MTTVSRPPRPGWWRLLLAAIAALLVGLLGAGTASATMLPEVETRVGASPVLAQVTVGVHECVSAGQRWDKAPPTAQIASATGVAAKAGAELPEGYSSFSAAKRAMGSPGEGNVFDHVVEQSQIRRSGFAAEEIHNPFNMNPVSARTNQIKANFYSSKQPFTGNGTVRDWLTGQSFADQYQFGMQTLADINAGIIK